MLQFRIISVKYKLFLRFYQLFKVLQPIGKFDKLSVFQIDIIYRSKRVAAATPLVRYPSTLLPDQCPFKQRIKTGVKKLNGKCLEMYIA